MMKLHLVKFIVLLKVFVLINCGSVLESNGTDGKDIDATDLIALGREINDPFISLIGQVIKNYHVCTALSNWTECGAMKTEHYSTTTRTRQCGVDRHEETQINVCEGGSLNKTKTKICPLKYEVTENGFCLMLYTEKKNRNEAESLCKNDGGFLINIDSDKKYADVNAVLTANNSTRQIHIDGRSKNDASPWEYHYGSGSGYCHWFSGYPLSDQDRLCLMQTGNREDAVERFRMFNNKCSISYQFICEVSV